MKKTGKIINFVDFYSRIGKMISHFT